MIKFELKGLDELAAALEKLSKQGVRDATRETLTNLAWEGRRTWQGRLEQSSTLRSQFTTRRVFVEAPRGGPVRGMEARLGHTEDYVRKLEAGEGDTAKGSAVPIPEVAARGGNKKRRVTRAYKLSAIGKLKKGKAPTRKGRNARAIRDAAKTGKKLVLLDMGRRKGIFRVMGGRKRIKLRKIWDLSSKAVTRPKRPTLARTLEHVLKLGPRIAERALAKQFAKLGAK